ncbi:ATP-binding protein [Dactylosporangium sp. NPDC000244]|uniref:ATP-binding protein n=1 Tax=Dactylosporangium sp. NPDC000244 TaxID=3154365 RepID=UPI003323B0E3|nr:anti-sigma regulatory factor [Dactylosporangium thailandense]
MTQVAPKRSGADGDDVVLLAVPASPAYLGVLRTATAGLAARLQFTLDEIEDLRIAVDEACAMLLAVAADTPQLGDTVELSCRFTVTPDALTVYTTVPLGSPDERLPGGESFAWQVLSALADEVSASVDAHQAGIRLTKRRPSRS